MNGVWLADSSTVVYVKSLTPPHALRCFECGWGTTVAVWKDALTVGHEHEEQHGKGPALMRRRLRDRLSQKEHSAL